MTGRRRLVELAHAALAETIADGDVVVDATVGNGHDTLFLAHQVGNYGKVYGFDIQKTAIRNARSRLVDQGVAGRVELICAGHERMPELIPEENLGRVTAVVFNLGYLPGGDKHIVTRPETTLQALDAALGSLSPDGAISIIAYPGHSGGRAETGVVFTWSRGLDPRCHSLQIVPPVEESAATNPRWMLVKPKILTKT